MYYQVVEKKLTKCLSLVNQLLVDPTRLRMADQQQIQLEFHKHLVYLLSTLMSLAEHQALRFHQLT